jgi:acid phosphatase type 7
MLLASFAAERKDPVLVGAGDIGDCNIGADVLTGRMIEAMRAVVFTAGDEAYPGGSAEDFADCYEPSWGRFRDRTLPTIGNHEYVTDDARGYFGYFGSTMGSPGRPWYSLEIGAWHVVILDSDCDIVGCGVRSAQHSWLKADLAGSRARCTLAIWHHPRFSSGGHGNGEEVAPLWNALMAAGADVVVNGHDHDYERFAPQTPRGRLDRSSGIREFVVGTGGAQLRRFRRIKPNSRVRLSAHGVLRLTLHPSSYTWRFLPIDGSIGDRGTTSCH